MTTTTEGSCAFWSGGRENGCLDLRVQGLPIALCRCCDGYLRKAERARRLRVALERAERELEQMLANDNTRPPTELEIVSDPKQWPFDSVLCLAHRRDIEDGLPALGVVLRTDLESGVVPTVYLAELEIVLQRLRSGEPVRTRSYESWEALLEDWRVD